MNTVKNCHSPAGMGYSQSGARLTNLTDCPVCKYGTVDRLEKVYRCADCGKEWTVKEFEILFPAKAKR